MDFLELAKTRCSIRKYKATPIEAEKLESILEAGRIAPTACNNQPFQLLVVQSKEGLAKVAEAANIFHAPLAIIVCADHAEAWTRPLDGKSSADIDASIVTDHLMLEATEQGLGSVWICYFNAEKLCDAFSIPEQYEPINILAIGYADEPSKAPNRHDTLRQPLERLVRYETFE
ncbi:MAG: nitroreductase family protein [Eubacteriales bacterium]|nr:nitroreductase family protein [Eubacteriales bacterium]